MDPHAKPSHHDEPKYGDPDVEIGDHQHEELIIRREEMSQTDGASSSTAGTSKRKASPFRRRLVLTYWTRYTVDMPSCLMTKKKSKSMA